MERATSQNKRTSIQSNSANKTPPLQGIRFATAKQMETTLFQKTNPDVPTKVGPQSPRKKYHMVDEFIYKPP